MSLQSSFTKKKIQNGLKEVKKLSVKESFEIDTLEFFEDEKRRFKPHFNDEQFSWKTIKIGERWGGYDKIYWFRKTVQLPNDFKGEKLFLKVNLERDGDLDVVPNYPESLLFANGKFIQGIDKYHKEAIISSEVAEDGKLDIYLRSWTGLRGEMDYTFSGLEFLTIDESSQKYYFLAKNILNTLEELDENNIANIRLLDILNNSYNKIDFIKPQSDEYYNSIKDSYNYLRRELEKLDNFKSETPKVVLTGHSHIDMAWLWRIKHTREKAQRTFSTVLNLMEEYPEYTFMHSSPALYKFLKNDYPEFTHFRNSKK